MIAVDTLPIRRTPAFNHLEGLLARNDEDDDRLLRLIMAMPDFAIEVLLAANSDAWGRGMMIDRLDHAVILLGKKGIREVADDVLRRPNFEAAPNELARTFADHAMAVSVAAEVIAQASELPVGPIARTAGIVHDVGFLILAETRADELRMAIEQSKNSGSRIVEHERMVLGTDHAEVGEAWLSANGFPPSLVAVAAFHHDPMIAPADHRYLSMLIYAAECTARHGGYSQLDGEMAPALEDRVLEELRLNRRIIEAYSETLTARVSAQRDAVPENG